jgi:hypothetical protein
MLEECRLPLVGNSDSEKAERLVRSPRHGVIALLVTRVSKEPVVRDHPAVAPEAGLPRILHASNLRMILADVPVIDPRWVLLVATARWDRQGKREETKPIAKCLT